MGQRFNTEQRIFICYSFLKNKSAAQCRVEFKERFPGVQPPDRSTVRKIVHKFKTTGSVLDKKIRRRRHVLTEEKLDDIAALLEESPRKSLAKLAQQAGVSHTSAHSAKKLLNFHVDKVTEVHDLQPTDSGRRNFIVREEGCTAATEYFTMNVLSPTESGELIAKHAGQVSVHAEGVKNISEEILKRLKSKELHIDNFLHHELHPQIADEKAIDWLFLVDTLNFCFWSADNANKWKVTFNGKCYTGYFALCAAINRALKEGVPVTDPKYYGSITSEQFQHICRSDSSVQVPLLKERVECLHQVGKVLLDKYDGTFVTCIKESKNSAQKLLTLIVTNFLCYKDEATYKGHRVALYKRAQILIGDIWSCFRGKGLGQFDDIDSITMFADYRIPQVLVHYGVMKYSGELTRKLKEGKILENGSEEEVEIRGCSIYAVELIADEVRKLLKAEKTEDLIVNAILIDQFLWDYRRKNAEMLENIPFHRTCSVYY